MKIEEFGGKWGFPGNGVSKGKSVHLLIQGVINKKVGHRSVEIMKEF